MRYQDQTAARLAARQHGVVSLEQLRALGLTTQGVYRRVQAGRLHRLYRGVYAVGHRALTQKGRWMAAVLACGPTAVLSHHAALALWELRPWQGGPIDVTVVSRGRRSLPGIRLHCVRALHRHDHLIVDAIPVTSVARTLLDHAYTATREELRTALEAADRSDRLYGIEKVLLRSPGRATRRLADGLAALTGSPPWTRSEMERQFLALVREAGLPEPQCNVIVLGTLADFFWPAQGLIVEADSWGFHRGRAQFEEDRRRDVQRQLAGLRAARFTQRRMQEDRPRVQAELRGLLSWPRAA